MSISCFTDVIDLWPSSRVMGAELGTSLWTVLKWRQRDSIPAEWWSALLGLPRAREAGITAELLADLAAKREAAA